MLSDAAVSFDVARTPLILDQMAFARWPEHAPFPAQYNDTLNVRHYTVHTPNVLALRPGDFFSNNGKLNARKPIRMYAPMHVRNR